MLIIGKKIGMTQLFDDTGRVVPVSVIQAGPCPITQVKTLEKEGYSAIQIGFDEKREKLITNPMLGHFKKAGCAPQRVVREVRLDDVGEYAVGGAIDVSAFEGTEKVHVTGTTKGRGFTGTVKRHNFKVGRRTHGNSNHRAPGSVGQCATPSRIFKGKRLAGRSGGAQRTARNCSLVRIDTENNLLFVMGSVPGANNGIVFVRKA
jgi:large subunit ribosomal protein L3